MTQKIGEQTIDLSLVEIASPEPLYQKGLEFEQPLAKKTKFFEDEPNDMKSNPMTLSIVEDSSKFEFLFEF
jgi:hypothetical protein